MKRKLPAQMRTEWRGNTWMVLEFALMTMVFWFSASYLIAIADTYHPSEYDFDDVYVGHLGGIAYDSPHYSDYGENADERYATDLAALIKELENLPQVEIVGTGSNAIPFNYNFSGHQLCRVNEKGDTLRYNFHLRFYDGNALKALRVTGTRGETSEQLASYLENGQMLLSDYDRYSELSEDLVSPDEFRGKDAMMYGRTWPIAPAGVPFMRRTDYESNGWSGVLMCPMSFNDAPSDIIIRIKHGHDLDFQEAIHDMNLRHGNLYIYDIKSVASIRENTQKPIEIQILKQVAAIAFVLVLVFLGFLGTYWFRIQERTSEIAIRKVAGATRGDVLRRLFGEGLILMGIAVAIAMGLSLVIVHKDLLSEITGTVLPEKSCYYAMVLTVVVMALMVLAGIYFPARRAMKVNPAIALKDQ